MAIISFRNYIFLIKLLLNIKIYLHQISYYLKETVADDDQESFTFFEWKLNSILNLESDAIDSQVSINDYPLALSCSYNGRFAVAFKKNKKLSDYFKIVERRK